MTRSKNFIIHTISVMALALLPLALFFFLLANPAYDASVNIPSHHFFIVSLISLLALALGVLTCYSAYRLNAPSVLLLSLSFLGIAGVFAIHGLTTPGMLHGLNPVIGISARLSVLIGAIFFALSTAPLSPSQRQWIQQNREKIILGMLGFLTLYGAVGIFAPDAFNL